MSRIRMRAWVCLTGLVVLASCTGEAGSGADVEGPIAKPADGEVCPITVANGNVPDGEYPGPDYHGNGELWTLLPEDGTIVATDHNVHPDGSIRVKFPWWRGVTGDLSISGRRLDGSAPPAQTDIPSGYSITGFQASGIIFPGPGCWEVTREAGGSSLTFVTLVSDPLS